jgi:hypothetical protein
MTQHSSLTPERWSQFCLRDQILMIANEMNRARSFLGPGDEERLRRSYERSLRLTDLTIEVPSRPALRRELLRWRDLIAELYISDSSDPRRHRQALRALLSLHPEAFRQCDLLEVPAE